MKSIKSMCLLRSIYSKQCNQKRVLGIQVLNHTNSHYNQYVERKIMQCCIPSRQFHSTLRYLEDEKNLNTNNIFESIQTTQVPGVQSSGEKFIMMYTCKVCETRSAKTISKHSYQHGVVLVRCPGCEKLHLIADHLGWFDDESVDVETILREKGEEVRYATHDNVLEIMTKEDIELLENMKEAKKE